MSTSHSKTKESISNYKNITQENNLILELQSKKLLETLAEADTKCDECEQINDIVHDDGS